MTRSIEVLYVVSTLKATGPINLLFDIVKNLDKSRFHVSVLTLSPESSPSRQHDFADIGITIHQMGLSRFAMALLGSRKFKKVVKAINPDIIHGHGLRPDFYISQLSGVKTFSTVHNFPHLDYPFSHGKFLGGLMSWVELESLRRMTSPIACSNAISDELNRRFGIHTSFIRNGVDTDAYDIADADQKSRLREKYGIPNEARVFISVGWLTDRKNPLATIRMFREAQLGDSFRLIIIGKGKLSKECSSLANNNVRVLDYVEDLDEYMKLADYYVSASKAEGMPRTVLQAMACGLPVVLSDIPPHREIFDLNASIGFLFDSENAQDLLRVYREIESLNQVSAGKEARITIDSHFSNERMARHYEDSYLAALN